MSGPRRLAAWALLGLGLVAAPAFVLGQRAPASPAAEAAAQHAPMAPAKRPRTEPAPEPPSAASPAEPDVEAPRTFGAVDLDLPAPDCLPVREDPRAESGSFPVPTPPFSEVIFPCTRCHDRPNDFNLEKRNLTLFHTNIKLVHGPREQWCYGCHNPTARDQLRLAGGRLVPFTESHQLCGQCHGEKLRDWRLGIHGRRTGCWNGPKEYLLCVHCHDPHAPKIEGLKPKPRPRKPDEIRWTGGGGAGR